MQRRNFVKALTAGALVPSVLAPMDSRAEGNFENKAKPKKVLMKVGCQSGGTTEENLQLKGRCGVYNIDGGSPKFIPGVGWDLEDSFRKRDACEKYGISLDAYHWALTSAGIDKVSVPNVMLGKSPERDREIDMLNQMIMVAGKTGVKVMNYNTTILPVLRTGKTVDSKRGNAEYSTWNYAEALKRNDPKTIAGDVDIDEMFERITYLLDRTLPVAKEYNVKGQVGHVERFNPAFIAVKDMIESPMFIETHRLAEFNPRGTDVPVVLDLMIHDIDAILSVVKSKVKAVHASGVSVLSQSPDIANARIEFENGCVANITSSRISMKNMRKSRFFQKDAYISVDYLDKICEVVKMKEAPQVPGDFDMILQNAEGEKKQIYFANPEVSQNNAILDELETFADAIVNDTTPIVTLEDGTEALRVAYMIIDSMENKN